MIGDMTLTGLSFFVIICVKRCLDCWISHPGVTSRADGEHSLALTVWFLCTQHASGKTKQKNAGWKSHFCIYFSVMIPFFFFINFKRRMLPDVCLTFNATVTPVSGGRRLWHDQRWLWFFFLQWTYNLVAFETFALKMGSRSHSPSAAVLKLW